MFSVITTFKKLMLLIFLWKEGFVFQIELIHMFEVDLLLTEMTFKTLTAELAMSMPYTY